MPGLNAPPPPPNLAPKNPQGATPSGVTTTQPAEGYAPRPANAFATPTGFAAPNGSLEAPPPISQPSGVTMSQGTEFDPEAFDKGNSLSSGDPFADIDSVLNEEEQTKRPLNLKLILIIGGAVVAILAVIITIVVIIANNGNSGDEGTANTDGIIFSDSPIGNNAGGEIVFPDPPADVPAEETAPVEPVPEPVESSSSEPEDVIPSFHYETEDADSLRAVGYTAAEIEAFEADENRKPVYELVQAQEKNIRKKLTEEYQNMIRALQNATGDESQEFLRTTWYGYPVQILREEITDDLGNGEAPIRSSMTQNVDYEKIPLHGKQAWLRITLDNGDVVFMEIDPVRYKRLEKETGNIVITLVKTEYLDGVFYADIKEKRVN